MASSATLPHLRPLSTAECYLTPLSATKASSLFLSLSSRRTKPIRCRPLSFSSPFRTSLRSRTSPSPPNIITLVAQTSDWAQQEQELQLGEEDLNWEAESQSLSPDFLGDGDTPEEGLEAGDEPQSLSPDFLGDGDTAEEGLEAEDEYPEPPEEAKLFVGNLPYDIDSNKLAEVFQAAGVVEICEVIFNRETGQSRGFGFVTMSTVEEAENAIGMFNRSEVNGRRLNVNKAAPRGSQPDRPPRVFEPIFKLYVGNLPWQIDNARLEQVFSEHGKVVSARVAVERDSGRSRGFGFVTMSSEAELNDAMAALDGQDLDGRTIRVNVAEERQRRFF